MTSGNKYVNLWTTKTLAAGIASTPDLLAHCTQHGIDYMTYKIEQEQNILDYLVTERDTHEPGSSGGSDRARFQHNVMLLLRTEACRDKMAIMTDQWDALAGEQKPWE